MAVARAQKGRRHEAKLQTMETMGGAQDKAIRIHKHKLRSECLNFNKGGVGDIVASWPRRWRLKGGGTMQNWRL